MANYTGVRCPVCSKKFSSSDDIVVCPVCGAPHHRACYAQQGACAFLEDHISGKEWTPPPSESGASTGGEGGAYGDGAYGDGSHTQGSGSGTKACPSCGGQNPVENVFCQSCGHRLFAREQRPGPGYGMPGMPGMGMDPVSMAYGGLNPDEEIDGIPVKELAVYVGPNSMYYLPRFAAIATGRAAFLPNFAAFFANFFYFFYRKMYAIGAILLAFFLVGLIPSLLYYIEMLPSTLHQLGLDIDPVINVEAAEFYYFWSNVVGTVRLFVGVFVSIFANRLYYKHTMRTMHALRDESQGGLEAGYREQVVLRGGVNRTLVIVLLVTLAIGSFVAGVLMAQTVPL